MISLRRVTLFRSTLFRSTVLLAGLLAGGGFYGCRSSESGRTEGAPAAQSSLPQILQEIDGRLDPQTFAYNNAGRAILIKKQIDRAAQGGRTQEDPQQLEFQYASELLNAGKTEEALSALEALERKIQSDPPLDWPTAKI